MVTTVDEHQKRRILLAGAFILIPAAVYVAAYFIGYLT
jgi:hypothetical protein